MISSRKYLVPFSGTEDQTNRERRRWVEIPPVHPRVSSPLLPIVDPTGVLHFDKKGLRPWIELNKPKPENL